MNVLFIMRYPLASEYNLKQKFDGQMRAVVNLGHHVWHLAYDKKSVYLVDVNTNTITRLRRTHFGSWVKYRNTFGFLDLYFNLYHVTKMLQFDNAYIRSKPIDVIGLRALKLIKRKGGKLIVEIPTYPNNEKPLNSIRIIISRLLQPWKRKLFEMVDLYTVIGSDVGGSYCGRRAMNIHNGVCIEQIPVRIPQSHNAGIHILALASMRYWHGYDRLIAGLAQYRGRQSIIIHMVGNDGDGSLDALKEYVKNNELGNKVQFHGALYGEALTRMFNQCDIGVASLGLHRNANLDLHKNTVAAGGSVLKSREYTARGLPFIYAYNDQVLSGDESFALKIPMNDDPVDIEHMLSWYQKISGTPNISVLMRAYAEKYMSWELQFQQVFEHLLKTNLTNELETQCDLVSD